MPQWIPQNIQKRLLRYILQQLSVFSEIDLSDLDVSLGHLNLKNVLLNPDSFKVPGVFLRSGQVGSLELNLTVSGGIQISGSDLEAILVLRQEANDPGEFSLAQSRADLASSIMTPREFGDEVLSDDEGSSVSSGSGGGAEDGKEAGNTFYANYVNKAVELALSKLQVTVERVCVKVVVGDHGQHFFLEIDRLSWRYSSENKKCIQLDGVRVAGGRGVPAPPKLLAVVKEEEYGSDDEEYNQMMTSSYLPQKTAADDDEDSSTMFLSANSNISPTMLLTMHKIKEDAGGDREKEKLIDSICDVAVGKGSAVHHHGHVTGGQTHVAFDDDAKVYLIGVSKVAINFEGLLKFEDLDISVEDVNVSLRHDDKSSIFDVAESLLGQIEKAKRAEAYNRRRNKAGIRKYSKFGSGNSITLGGNDTPDEPKQSLFSWFSKIVVKNLRVGLDSFLDSKGSFSESDGVILQLEDVNVNKKNDSLIFGGIRKISAKDVFGFSDGLQETAENHDLRFQYDDSSITVLFSKIAELNLTKSLLDKVKNLYDTRVTKLLEIVKKFDGLKEAEPGSLASSLIFLGRGARAGRSQSSSTTNLVIQSNIIKIKVEELGLQVDVLPMSFSENKLTTPKMNVFYREKPVCSVGEIEFSKYQKPLPIKAFDINSKEVVYHSDLKLTVKRVELEADFEDVLKLSEDVKVFLGQPGLATPEEKWSNKLAGGRKVRINVATETSIFVQIDVVSLLVRSVYSERFGDIKAKISGIAISSSGDLQVIIDKIWVLRLQKEGHDLVEESLSEGKNLAGVEQVVNISNPEDNLLPLIGVKLEKNGGRGFLRNLRVEYYAQWLGLFETAEAPASTSSASGLPFPAVKFRLVDCVVGLNPSRLHCKSLLLIDKGDNDIIVTPNELLVKFQLRNVSLFLIDDVKNVLSYNETKKKRQWTSHNKVIPSWSQISWYLSSGYTNVININCLNLQIIKNDEHKLKDSVRLQNSVLDIKSNIDVVKLELCADSSQTLSQLFNDLKQPVVLSDQEKYKVEYDQDLDVFGGVDMQMFKTEHDSHEDSALHEGNILDLIDNINELALQGTPEPEEIESIEDAPTIDIVDDYYSSKIESGSGSGIGSSISKHEMEENESILTFEESHFNKELEGEEKVILPAKVYCSISRAQIYLHDGFDWKDTRVAIRKAVREVEETGYEAWEKRKEEAVDDDSHSRKSVEEPPPRVKRRDSLGEFGFKSFEDEDEETPSVINQELFDSIYINLPYGSDPQKLVAGINKIINDDESVDEDRESSIFKDKKVNYKKLKLRRSKKHKMLINLKEVEVDVNVLNSNEPAYGQEDSQGDDFDDSSLLVDLKVKVQDFEIIDNIPTSTWNKFVTFLRDSGERELGVDMLNLSIGIIRPNKRLASQELILKVKVLPLKLHVDQDTLEFLVRFGSFKDRRFLFDKKYDEILFIQRFEVNSVRIKLDYKPKKVDYLGIKSGNSSELMNFFILDGAEILLKRVVLYGIPGMDKLNDSLNALWMPDIRSTQLKGIISGLAPSVSKLGGGIKDLVIIPVNEYKKDGRLINSIQKGAYAFVRTTTNELLKFGVKLAAGTQTILENTEEVLGGEGSGGREGRGNSKKKEAKRGLEIGESMIIGGYEVENMGDDLDKSSIYGRKKPAGRARAGGRYYNEAFSESDEDELEIVSDLDEADEDDLELRRIISLYSKQPENAAQGISLAYTSLERNFGLAKNIIVKAGNNVADSGSAKKAGYVIAKATPIAIIRPMIGATEAISKTLLGVTNQIDPEQIKDAKEKYK